jgi:hypothetical protein
MARPAYIFVRRRFLVAKLDVQELAERTNRLAEKVERLRRFL